MAIAPATTETGYLLAGVNVGPFGTIWPYEQASDVQVWLTTTGSPVLLANGTDYSLAGASPLTAGGQVLLNGTLAGGGWPGGSQVSLIRMTSVDQPSTFGAALGFSPAASEAALDHVSRQVQDLWTKVRLGGGGGGGGGGPISSLDWSQLTGVPGTWPGAVSWGSITGRPAAWPGTLPWSSLTAVSPQIAAIAALGAPSSGQIVEFTSAGSAHYIATPSGGGGGGGGGSMQPQELSAYGTPDATGATSTGNDAAIAAAEAAADSAVYLRDGLYLKGAATPPFSNLTKHYVGRGKWKEGTSILPANTAYMFTKPTTAATQGLTGWFDGDQRFTNQSYRFIGAGVRTFDTSATHRYYESNTIPENHWLDILGGNSGVAAFLLAGTWGPGNGTLIPLGAAADASWVGKTVVFANTEGGTALDTKTVTAVNTAGNNITINSALANTYTYGTAQPCIRFALRTWHGHDYVKVNHSGGGDGYGHNVRITANRAALPNEYHTFMNQTAAQYGGDVNAGADGVYINCWESQLLDNGHDVTGIAFVQSFFRTNDAKIDGGRFWGGTLFQSVGSRPADAAHVISGFWRVGVDTAFATMYETTYLTAAATGGDSTLTVASLNGAHGGDNVQIGAEVLPIGQVLVGPPMKISMTVVVAGSYPIGTLVTYPQGGAAMNMAKGQRLVFGSTPNTAYRGGDPTGLFSTFYGNKQGDMFLDSGVVAANDYIALRIARGAIPGLPDTVRLRLKDDGFGNGIVQIFGTGTHTIAGLGLGFAAGCHINMSTSNQMRWGTVILDASTGALRLSNDGGATYHAL